MLEDLVGFFPLKKGTHFSKGINQLFKNRKFRETQPFLKKLDYMKLGWNRRYYAWYGWRKNAQD